MTNGTAGGGADPAARAELPDTRAPTLGRQHMEQQPDLADARPLEAELTLERQRPLHERRIRHPTRSRRGFSR